MIPESFIQELLNRVDVVDIIDKKIQLKKAGANFVACCPFHQEKSPSFTVSPSKQFYHCFGCGEHGSAISFLIEYDGLSFVEAVNELANAAGLKVPNEDFSEKKNINESYRLEEAMKIADNFYQAQLRKSPKAINYLKTRGLTGEIAKEFSIGYAPEGWQNLQAAFKKYEDQTLVDAGLIQKNEQGRYYDRFRDRIMFPIHNAKGIVIGFGGRGEKGEISDSFRKVECSEYYSAWLALARTAAKEAEAAFVRDAYGKPLVKDFATLYRQATERSRVYRPVVFYERELTRVEGPRHTGGTGAQRARRFRIPDYKSG